MLAPEVGQWYRHLDKGQQFQVIAIDEESKTIEIQHFDGDVEELEPDDWAELEIEATAEPEDWTGPIDDIERDDLGYSETGMSDEDWSAPLAEGGKGEEKEEKEED
jgi:hypothetical protein